MDANISSPSKLKHLIKGIIQWGNTDPAMLALNYQRLRASKLQWLNPADEKIFQFVTAFFIREHDLPEARVIGGYFEGLEDIEVVERLKDIKEAHLYEGANYKFVLDEIVSQQNRVNLMSVLKETQEVVSKGLTVGEGKEKQRIEGVKEAILYFQRKSSELLVADSNAKTRGTLNESARDAWADYQFARDNPGLAFGKFCGLPEVDKCCMGLKKGELWTHAAFTGELKSTLALNWVYNLVTKYKSHAFYVSLEMPFKQIRNMLCTMHASHPKWNRPHLDYRKVRDGQLSPEEEKFYKVVLDDLENNEEYHDLEIWCPDHDVTVADIKMEAELLHKRIDVGFICIDHGGLVQASKAHRDYTIALNSVVRGAKQLALHFNHGEGIPVLFLFQLNRQGKDEAAKNNGRYKLSALSYSNECERSSDVVTTTYLDDALRAKGATTMCCLKNRDNPLFSPFEVGVNFSCRRMTHINPDEGRVDMNADALSDMLDVA